MLEGVNLRFRLGDTWASPQWAVLIDDLSVDLTDGWVVRCQARRTTDSAPVQEWSTENNHVRLGEASVEFGNTGESDITSTIQLFHSAAESDAWDPFSAYYEVEIERGSGENVERHTIVAGRMTALQDISDT